MADEEKPRHVRVFQARRSGNTLLRAALGALLGRSQVVEPVKPDLGNAIRERAGAVPLNAMKLVGVPPGHKHEPEPYRFNIEGNICYVRAAELPRLKAAIERQRAKRGAHSEMPVSKRETGEEPPP